METISIVLVAVGSILIPGIAAWIHTSSRITSLEKDVDTIRLLRKEDREQFQQFMNEIRDDMKEIKEGIGEIKVDLQNKADKD